MIATQPSAPTRPDVEAVKQEWKRTSRPDALGALALHPEWRAEKTIILELALEEYYQRYDAGERPDVDAYCDRFPTYRLQLRPLIETNNVMAEEVGLLDRVTIRWPAPGERLGDLTLLRELGRGAFARVYLATEESAGGRPVAVKFSKEGAGEARTMGRLTHPGVVPVHWARLEPGVGLTAVCMPFLGAATLMGLIDRAYPTAKSPPPRSAAVLAETLRAAARPGDPAPLSSAGAAFGRGLETTPQQGLGTTPQRETAPQRGPYTDAVARLGLQIAEALTFLHAQGVVHRDLKPSNVLLGPDGRAQLLDFNLAADARAGRPVLGGTPPYMAPEQLRALVRSDEHAALDERVDLFALGLILYELLTGKKPFGEQPAHKPPLDAAAILLDRQTAGFVPLRSRNPAVDRRLARLVEECLAFDPARRPGSATDVAARLRAYLSPPARLRRWVARRPWRTAAAAALVLLAAGAAAADLAARDPADVQAYKQGRDAYLKGDYRAAREAFGQALQKAPTNAKYLRARAEAELRLGEAGARSVFSEALHDFGTLNRRQPDGATTALEGYCFSRMDQHEIALAWYDKAEEAGFAPASLFNDRAYSALSLQDWDRARGDLQSALGKDPNLTAALYNRAVLVVRSRPLSAPPAIPEDVLQGMRTAAAGAPPSRQLYLNAARLFTAAAQDDRPANRQRSEEAVAYLQRACALGEDPKGVPSSHVFQSVLGPLPGFRALQKGLEQPSAADVDLRLIDPAPYLPD